MCCLPCGQSLRRFPVSLSVNMTLRCLVLISVLSVTAADFYSSKYDDFDIQPILENDRIMLGYIRCFLDQGPCTPDAKDFKKVIPEALQTTCGKCTPKQKQLIRKVVRGIMEKHPESWKELVEKFDKDKTYRANFDKFLAEEE